MKIWIVILVIFSFVALTMPGFVMIGFMLGMLPGFVLGISPTLLVYTLFACLIWSLFANWTDGARKTACVLAVGLLAFALPYALDTPQRIAASKSRSGDIDLKDFSLSDAATVSFVKLLNERSMSKSTSSWNYSDSFFECEELCLKLLYNDAVRSFAISAMYEDVDFRKEAAIKSVTYRIQQQSPCPPLVRNPNQQREQNSNMSKDSLQRRVLGRLSNGDCLVSASGPYEPGSIIFSRRDIDPYRELHQASPFNPFVPTVQVGRAEIWERAQNGFRAVFRHTWTKQETLFPFLAINPLAGPFRGGVPALARFNDVKGLVPDDILHQRIFGSAFNLPASRTTPDGERGKLIGVLKDEGPFRDRIQDIADSYLNSLAQAGRLQDDDIAVIKDMILDRRYQVAGVVPEVLLKDRARIDVFAESMLLKALDQHDPANPFVQNRWVGIVGGTSPERFKELANLILRTVKIEGLRMGSVVDRLAELGEDGERSLIALIRLSIDDGTGRRAQEQYWHIAEAAIRGVCKSGVLQPSAFEAMMELILREVAKTSGQKMYPLQGPARKAVYTIGKLGHPDAILAIAAPENYRNDFRQILDRLKNPGNACRG